MTELEQAIQDFPPMWVIYVKPADYPEDIVVRVWYGEVAGPLVGWFDNTDDAREFVIGQGASHCLGRYAEDDPVILEAWL